MVLRDVPRGVLRAVLGAGTWGSSGRYWNTLGSGPIKRLLGRSSMRNIETPKANISGINSVVPEFVQGMGLCELASLTSAQRSSRRHVIPLPHLPNFSPNSQSSLLPFHPMPSNPPPFHSSLLFLPHPSPSLLVLLLALPPRQVMVLRREKLV